MATSNVNKIVRGNLNLKPWILNKTPTDIVNSYVQQLYKQVPDSYKKDLFKPRNNAPVQQPPEKRPPPFRFTFPIVNQPKKTLRPNGCRSSQITVNNNFVPAPKKFLKSPNFKIYNSRKYSSASSSGASFFRSDFEERRKQLYKPANGIQVRTYAGATTTPGSNFYNSPGIAKYIGPTRVFNDVSQHVKCLEITNAICKDLMSVDKILKEKIRCVKPKQMRVDPQISKQDTIENALSGWNHPTLSNLNKIQMPLFKKPPSLKSIPPERASSPFSMMQASTNKKGNPGKASKQSIIPRTPRRENARYEASPFPPYFGVNVRSYDTKGKDQSSEKQVKAPEGNDAMERVCRSRMDRERNARTSRPNQRRSLMTTQAVRRF